MSDAHRAVLVFCASISAWAYTGEWRLAALALMALTALAPWKDDA